MWLAALLAWTLGAALARSRFAVGTSADTERRAPAANALGGSPRDLRRLPAIGEARAIAIARERWARRGDPSFALDDVRGIGPVTIERIEAWLARSEGGE